MTPLMRMFWAFFYKLLLSAISLGTSVITSRYMGPVGRGHLTLAMTYQNYYSPVIGSFSEYITFGINKRKEPPQDVFSAGLFFCLIFSGLLFVLAAAGTPWLLHGFWIWDLWTTRLMWFAGLIAPFVMFHVYVTRLMWGVNELTWLNRLNTVQAASFLVWLLIMLVVAHGKGHETVYVLGAFGLSWVTASLVAAYAVRKQRVSIRPRITKEISGRMFRYGAQLAGGNLMTVLNSRVDILIVTAMLGFADTGKYGIGVTVAEMLNLISSSVLQVVLTRVASLDQKDSTQLTARTFRYTGAIVLVSMVGMYLVMPWVMLLFFGLPYKASIYNFLILLPGVAMSSLAGVLTAFFNNQLGRPKVTALLQVLSIAVNLVVSLLLIPQLGDQGSATAKTVAYATFFFAAAIYFAKATNYPFRQLFVLLPSEKEQFKTVYRKVTDKLLKRQKDQR